MNNKSPLDSEALIEVKNLSFNRGERVIYDDISLKIRRGQITAIMGPSGTGKTTLLRLIGGQLTPDQGCVLLDGKDLSEMSRHELFAARARMGMLFQSGALFTDMTVYENVAFALKLRRRPESEIREKVKDALHTVRLDGYANREISELSGGQQQRVAIARAIINEPKVLLLDECLSALDKRLRKEMQFELRAIQKKLGITFIFVTHDQEEALAMSDEIFVLNDGEIQQSGSPVDIYDEPVNDFVARFIGDSNILSGRMIRDFAVEFAGKDFECADAGITPGEKVEVVLRPEDLDITAPAAGKLMVRCRASFSWATTLKSRPSARTALNG